MYGFRFTVYRLDFARCAKPPVFLHFIFFRTGELMPDVYCLSCVDKSRVDE